MPLPRLAKLWHRLQGGRPPPLATAVLDRGGERWRGLSVAGLLGAAGLALWGVHALRDAAERTRWFDMGTIIYKRAFWASTVAVVAFGVTLLAGAIWLLAASARGALRLPAPRRPTWRGPWLWLRGLPAAIVAYELGYWAADEFFARGAGESGPRRALLLGLVACGLLAYDAPRLLWNSIALVRLRAPLGRARRTTIRDVVAGERVRVRGAVADSGVALRKAGSFILEDRGARIFVDVDPARSVATEETAAAGDVVEVAGDVATAEGGEAYRDALPRLTAGHRPLWILAGEHAQGRRLYTAAAIEAAAGVALLACLAALPLAYRALSVYVAVR